MEVRGCRSHSIDVSAGPRLDDPENPRPIKGVRLISHANVAAISTEGTLATLISHIRLSVGASIFEAETTGYFTATLTLIEMSVHLSRPVSSCY